MSSQMPWNLSLAYFSSPKLPHSPHATVYYTHTHTHTYTHTHTHSRTTLESTPWLWSLFQQDLCTCWYPSCHGIFLEQFLCPFTYLIPSIFLTLLFYGNQGGFPDIIGWMVAPLNRYDHIITPRTYECDLTLEKGSYRHKQVKDLEMTASWIIWVGPKSRDKCPYRRHRG